MSENSSSESDNADDKSENADGQDGSLPAAFGARLRRIGEERGLNASEIGRRAGIPKQTMSGYWKGERLCATEKIFDLADVLGVSARWLVTGEGSIEPPVEADTIAPDSEAALLADFRAMQSWQQAALLSMAGTLLGRNTIELADLKRGDPAGLPIWQPPAGVDVAERPVALQSPRRRYRAPKKSDEN